MGKKYGFEFNVSNIWQLHKENRIQHTNSKNTRIITNQSDIFLYIHGHHGLHLVNSLAIVNLNFIEK